MTETLLTYQQALEKIHEVIKPAPITETGWRDAPGTTLAQDIFAAEDLPAYDNSAVDGFAVRSEDLRNAGDNAPVSLEVIEAVYAAQAMPQRRVEAGQAAKIMTGAPLPDGADAVVMVEHTKPDGSCVRVFRPVYESQNIRARAEEIRRGAKILSQGTRINSAELGLLALQGILSVPVRKNPAVAILPTGDELVEPEEKDQPVQIRNTNAYTLAAELQRFGCEAIQLGIGRDDRQKLRSLIEEGLAKAGVLLTSGGVSAGEKDYLPGILREMGMKTVFHKLSVKPGKPLLFGELGGKYIFGLPGNVVSTMASYHLFVKPALRLLCGREEWRSPVWYVRLGDAVDNPGGRTNFVRGIVKHTPTGLPVAFAAGKQGSGMLSSMVGAEGFIVIPADVPRADDYSVLEFIPITAD